ncbi:signal peptidase I [Bdellovibrionota bacterium FG-1]
MLGLKQSGKDGTAHSSMNTEDNAHETVQNSPVGQRPKTGVKYFLENIFSLGVALLIVFMVRSSIFESFKIPSGSMIPTLAIGDYIFVNKFAYGFKLPFSDLLLSEPLYLVKRAPPQRGDVIVFRFPKDESIYFIKRVVGVPGDRIELRDKLLYLNDQLVPRDPTPEADQKAILSGEVLSDPQYTVTNPDFFIEHLERQDHQKVDHLMILDKNNPSGRDFGPITVPSNSYFCMGDNRDVSNDSRYWGFVPMKNVAGRATRIWFSFWIVNFMEGKFYFHPSRIGTAIR